jgi:hypothetical protein
VAGGRASQDFAEAFRRFVDRLMRHAAIGAFAHDQMGVRDWGRVAENGQPWSAEVAGKRQPAVADPKMDHRGAEQVSGFDEPYFEIVSYLKGRFIWHGLKLEQRSINVSAGVTRVAGVQ